MKNRRRLAFRKRKRSKKKPTSSSVNSTFADEHIIRLPCLRFFPTLSSVLDKLSNRLEIVLFISQFQIFLSEWPREKKFRRFRPLSSTTWKEVFLSREERIEKGIVEES